MSTAAQVPFGRRWEIKIIGGQDAAGNADVITATSDSFEPEALRATFDVWQPGYAAWWYCDIEIYNFDATTSQKVLTEGMRVVVSAGYQQGNYGVIFEGRIFQAFVERENVFDFKTILHCVTGRIELANNLLVGVFDNNPKQADIAIQLATTAPTQLSLKYLAGLGQIKLPRGKTIFSDPGTYFDQLARDNKQVWWQDWESLNISDFNQPEPEAIVYTPSSGLIGTPTQTQQGVQFRVLLDSRMRVKVNPVQVKLDQTSLVFEKQLIGQLPSILDQDGLYVVGGVRHFGDTRGDAWYSDVIGYTTVGGKLGLLAATEAVARLASQQDIGQR